MTKTFIYMVNGNEFIDTKAFGQAWKDAKAVAKAEHCGIYRSIVEGDNIRNEFFAKGGCFLNEKFFEDGRIEIF